MKKVKLSLVVALAILGASVTAFTGKTTITPGWYGQGDDDPPYDVSSPINTSDLDAVCPVSTEHICAVELDMDGKLVATRKSEDNFSEE